MPLNGTAICVLRRVLVIERPPVVPNAAGPNRKHGDRGPALQLLLQRTLPHLPHQYRLVNAYVEAVLERAIVEKVFPIGVLRWRLWWGDVVLGRVGLRVERVGLV